MNYNHTLESAALRALLDTAYVVFAKALHEVPPALGMSVPQVLLDGALKASGVDVLRMRRQGYTAWVKVAATPELIANVNARSLYGGSPTHVSDRHHYLSISNGVLWVQYQSILGQWRLGDLDDHALRGLERTLIHSICHQVQFVERFAPLAA